MLTDRKLQEAEARVDELTSYNENLLADNLELRKQLSESEDSRISLLAELDRIAPQRPLEDDRPDLDLIPPEDFVQQADEIRMRRERAQVKL